MKINNLKTCPARLPKLPRGSVEGYIPSYLLNNVVLAQEEFSELKLAELGDRKINMIYSESQDKNIGEVVVEPLTYDDARELKRIQPVSS
ncbi:MAG: hypothetical protein AAGA16_22415 [Cyanobacteria bacterium P01_E01_bin.35]